MKWTLVYTKQAQKDAQKLAAAGLKFKSEEMLKLLELNPFQTPPRYEKLVGDLAGSYSRRINIQHRLVYQILEDRVADQKVQGRAEFISAPIKCESFREFQIPKQVRNDSFSYLLVSPKVIRMWTHYE